MRGFEIEPKLNTHTHTAKISSCINFTFCVPVLWECQSRGERQFLFFISCVLGLHLGVCWCLLGHAPAHVCACMERPEVILTCHFSEATLLPCFLRQKLSLRSGELVLKMSFCKARIVTSLSPETDAALVVALAGACLRCHLRREQNQRRPKAWRLR